MRHPTTHKFLAWAGQTSVIFAGGCLALLAAFAQSYPGVKDWGQKQFNAWWPTVSAPWFLGAGVAVICAYILALVYTGSQPKDAHAGTIDDWLKDDGHTQEPSAIVWVIEKVRNIFHKEFIVEAKPVPSMQMEVIRADERSIYNTQARTRIPFVAVREVAAKYGLNLDPRSPGAANVAYDLERELRQAAVDETLLVWGRKYQGPVRDNDPLVLIPAKHFEDYGFRHGHLHYETPNDQTATGTIGMATWGIKGKEGVTFYDLYLSLAGTKVAVEKVAREKKSDDR